MKIHLFQELLALEGEFGHVIHGLERMEKDPTCKKEMRAEKEWSQAELAAQVGVARGTINALETAVKTQLDQSSHHPSYVIAEALRVPFKRDDEFKAWLGQQSNNGNNRRLEGGTLKVTA